MRQTQRKGQIQGVFPCIFQTKIVLSLNLIFLKSIFVSGSMRILHKTPRGHSFSLCTLKNSVYLMRGGDCDDDNDDECIIFFSLPSVMLLLLVMVTVWFLMLVGSASMSI